MTLFFKHVCDLLSALEEISTRDPSYLPAIKIEKQKDVLQRWFRTHKTTLDAATDLTVAVFSAILPARRSDRVYNIQYSRLVNLLKRCLCLGVERQRLLDQWKIPGKGDLADCVERVLQQTDDHLTRASTMVTLEEVDAALATIASKSRFSGPKAREYEVDNKIQTSLENVLRRLHSEEAKWLTRMILKDFSCLDLKECIVYSAFDPRLPNAMEMYNDIESAITEHRRILEAEKATSIADGQIGRRLDHKQILIPQVGIKVGPPRWMKAKGGIKHAISIVDGRSMSVEQKHDGEYCQIHVDLAKGGNNIQIFSKSGKDSTVDRKQVHDAVEDGLRIGKSGCQFARNCILEGELLVWCDKTAAILEFHKTRKHVSRSGTFLGTTEDSPAHPWEHLMIVFYDALLIDDDAVIHQPYERRRQHLKKLVKKITGKSDIVWRKRVDFSRPEGPRTLIKTFAYALTQRWEGLVLKPADEPYFGTKNPSETRHPASWIKLKKDCIAGLGDTADLVAIGAAYDGNLATRLKIPNLHWTHFFIACLTNKEEVMNQGAKPSLLLFDCIHDCMRKDDVRTLNQHGQFREMKANSDEALKTFRLTFARLDPSLPKMLVVFKEPFVFEIAGSGFDKSPNQNIFTLRFPRVVKIHWDRDWRESVSLDELQALATEARTVPPDETSRQEHQMWVGKLDRSIRGAEGKKVGWDDTEDEEESLLFSEEGVSTTREESSSSSKTRTPVPTALFRMDTAEMRPGEKRSSTGEEVSNLILKRPSASRGNVNSLRRICSSPPAAKGKERAEEQPNVTNVSTTPTKVTQRLIKHANERKRCSGTEATNGKRPLQEMTNSARPAQKHPRPTTDNTHLAPPKADFKLVRKIPAGAGICTRNRHYKIPTRSKRLPSSPNRDTSSSAPTSITTSQLTAPPIPSTPPSSPLLTPLNTNQITLPNLTTTHILLNPHLHTSPHHNTITNLLNSLPPRRTLPFPLTTTSTRPSFDDPSTTTPPPLIFLIDNHPVPTTTTTTSAPTRLATTAHTLHTLALTLPNHHPRQIQIWDWRLLLHYHRRHPPLAPADQMKRPLPPSLEDIDNEKRVYDANDANIPHPNTDPTTILSTKAIIKSHYIATMSLEASPRSDRNISDAGGKDGKETRHLEEVGARTGMGGGEVVVVKWADGGVTRVGLEVVGGLIDGGVEGG